MCIININQLNITIIIVTIQKYQFKVLKLTNTSLLGQRKFGSNLMLHYNFKVKAEAHRFRFVPTVKLNMSKYIYEKRKALPQCYVMKRNERVDQISKKTKTITSKYSI